MSSDLFGNEVADVPLSKETSRRVTNDMNRVMAVLERACSETGYFIGSRSRVYRVVRKGVMKPVPLWESGVVLQLMASGQLTQGGGLHLMRCGALAVPRGVGAQVDPQPVDPVEGAEGPRCVVCEYGHRCGGQPLSAPALLGAP